MKFIVLAKRNDIFEKSTVINLWPFVVNVDTSPIRLVGDKAVGDGWVVEEFFWDVHDVEILAADSESSALRLHVLWKSPLWTDGKGRENA